MMNTILSLNFGFVVGHTVRGAVWEKYQWSSSHIMGGCYLAGKKKISPYCDCSVAVHNVCMD